MAQVFPARESPARLRTMTGIDLKEKGHNALSFNFKGKFFWIVATLANPLPRILPGDIGDIASLSKEPRKGL